MNILAYLEASTWLVCGADDEVKWISGTGCVSRRRVVEAASRGVSQSGIDVRFKLIATRGACSQV